MLAGLLPWGFKSPSSHQAPVELIGWRFLLATHSFEIGADAIRAFSNRGIVGLYSFEQAQLQVRFAIPLVVDEFFDPFGNGPAIGGRHGAHESVFDGRRRV